MNIIVEVLKILLGGYLLVSGIGDFLAFCKGRGVYLNDITGLLGVYFGFLLGGYRRKVKIRHRLYLLFWSLGEIVLGISILALTNII